MQLNKPQIADHEDFKASTTEPLRQFFNLKARIKELQEELKELEPTVFEQVSDEEDNKLDTEYAKFQIIYKPRWKYSSELTESVKKMKERIKILKKTEEADGTANQLTSGGQVRMTMKRREE